MGVLRSIRRARKRRRDATEPRKKSGTGRFHFESLEQRILLSADPITIGAGEQSALLDGLSTLHQFADDLDGLDEFQETLPVVNMTIGETLDTGSIVELLRSQASQYFAGLAAPGDGTTAGLTAFLNINLGTGWMVTDTSVRMGAEITFDVSITDVGNTLADLDLFLASEEALTEMGLEFVDGILPTVDLTTELDWNFTFGVELATDEFFIRSTELTAEASVNETITDAFGVNIGFLGTENDGTSSAFLGATLTTTLADPDSSGEITATELGGPIGTIASVVGAGTVDTTLELAVQPGFAAGESPPNARLVLDSSPDIFVTAPTLELQTAAGSLTDLTSFINVSATNMQSLMENLGSWLTELTDSELYQVEIPFVGDSDPSTATGATTLAQKLKYGEVWKTLVTDQLKEVPIAQDAAGADLEGANASTAPDGLTVLLNENVDLSGVPTDESYQVFVENTTTGLREFALISAVDDGLETVTVSTALTSDLSAVSWGIGPVTPADVQEPSFDTAQELAEQLTTLIGSNVEAHYDATEQTLSYDVVMNVGAVNIAAPLTFNQDTGALADLTSTSTITRMLGALTFDFTFGVDLQNLILPVVGVTTLIDETTGMIVDPPTPETGILSSDAEFDVTVQGTAGDDVLHMSVPASSTSTNDVQLDPEVVELRSTSLPAAAGSLGQLTVSATFRLTVGGTVLDPVTVNADSTDGFEIAQDAASNDLDGANASTDPDGLTVRLNDSIDLSGIPTDGSFHIFVDNPATGVREFAVISAVDDGLNTVTVSTALTADLSAVSWGIGPVPNATLQDLANDIQSALDVALVAGGFSAGFIEVVVVTDADLGGDVLAFRGTDTTVIDLRLEAVPLTPTASPASSATVAELGFDADQSASRMVDPRDELLADIQAGLDAQLAASVNYSAGDIEAIRFGSRIYLAAEEGTGIQFLKLEVPALNSGGVANAAAVGPDSTGLGFEDGQFARARVADLFLENANFDANLNFSAANVNVSGRYGYLGFGSTGGDTDINALIQVDAVDPSSPTPDRVDLRTLFMAQDIADVIDVTVTSDATVNLLNITVDDGFIPLGPMPEITLSLVDWVIDVDSPPATPPAVQVSLTPDFAPATDFENVDFETFVGALEDVADYLDQIGSAGFLADQLPFIDRSVNDLLDSGDAFRSVIEELEANPASTVQALESALLEALGLSSSVPAEAALVDVRMEGDDIRVDLDFQNVFNDALELSIDLEHLVSLVPGGVPDLTGLSSMIGTSSDGEVDVDVRALLDLAIGVDLGDPSVPRTFMADGPGGTGMTIEVMAVGSSMDFTAQVGPLGLFVVDGSVSISGAGADPGADYAVSIADNDGDGRHYFDALSADRIVDDSTVTVTGQAALDFPLFFPNIETPLGAPGFNILDIDIASLATYLAGAPDSVQITTPDIASKLEGLDPRNILRNPDILIDGMEALLEGLQEAVNAEVYSAPLPVIGAGFQTAAQFIQGYSQDLLNELSSQIPGATVDEIIGRVQLALFNVFELLLGPGATIDDVVVDTTDPDAIFFGLDLVQPMQLLADHPTFDLGLPALGFTLDAPLDILFGYQFSLRFGVDTTSGFVVDTSAANELQTDFDVRLQDPATSREGMLGLLHVDALDDAGDPSHFTGSFTVDIKDPDLDPGDNDGDALTLAELFMPTSTFDGDLIDATLTGSADIRMDLDVGFGTSSLFPTLLTRFVADWNFTDQDTGSSVALADFGDVPTITYESVRLSLGDFITGYVSPVLQEIFDVLEPFDWLIHPDTGFLFQIEPIMSFLEGRDVTVLETINTLWDGPIKQMTPFINAISELFGLAASITQIMDAGSLSIELGELSLPDVRPLTTLVGIFNPADPAGGPQPFSFTPGEQWKIQLEKQSPDAKEKTKGLQKKNVSPSVTVGTDYEIDFPILTKPEMAMNLLLGEQVDLFFLQLPTFIFDVTVDLKYIIWPVPEVYVKVFGGLSAQIQAGFGYDTLGIARFSNSNDPDDLADGFFFADRRDNIDVPELTLTATIGVGAGLNAGIAEVGGDAGIKGIVDFNLHDSNNDGKVRLDEIEANGELGFECVFDISGRLDIFAYFYLDVGVGIFSTRVATWDILATFGVDPTIYEFTIPCDRPPVLATDVGGALRLNMGAFAEERINVNTEDHAENFTVTQTGAGAVDVSAVLNGSTYVQSFTGISKIVAEGGASDDTIIIDTSTVASSVALPTEIRGNAGNDTITGGGGMDTLFGGEGDDSLSGGDGADMLVGDRGRDELLGEEGTDELFGGEGNDTISGGAMADLLQGDTGDDSLSGNDGNDTYRFLVSWGDDTVVESAGEGLQDTWDFFDIRTDIAFQMFSADLLLGTSSMLTARDLANSVTHTGSPQGVSTHEIEVLLGGRGDDVYDIFATGPNPLTLDGRSGSDDYLFHSGPAFVSDITAIDSGDPWNRDEIIVFGTEGDDELTLEAGGIDLGLTNIVYANIEATTFNMLAGEDIVNVRSTETDSSVIVNGDEGDDTINVGSLAPATGGVLDLIDGTPFIGPLVVNGRGGNDTLNLDDTGDTADNVGLLTADMITGLGMTVGIEYLSIEELNIDLGSGLDEFNVRATVATTSLDMGPGNDIVNVSSDAPTNAGTLNFLARLLSVTGGDGTDGVTVSDLGDGAGNEGLLTATMIRGLGMVEGIDYGATETLRVLLGSGDDRFNVQSTLSTTPVTLLAGAGDDDILVSSVANLSTNTPLADQFDQGVDLLGHVDDVLGLLTIDAEAGRNSLKVSDFESAIPDASVVITNQSIAGLAPADILYDAIGGDFSGGGTPAGVHTGGINVWGGVAGNVIDITSTKKDTGVRTMTTVHAGASADVVTATLGELTDGFLVIRGREGNDRVNGGSSTLDLVIFGDEGGDTLIGGTGEDLILGDKGRAYFLAPTGSGELDTLAGGAPDPLHTDGVANDDDPLTLDAVLTVGTAGDRDSITGGLGSDTILGGVASDTITGSEGEDVVLGDNGRVVLRTGRVATVESRDPNTGDSDTITGDVGEDILVGGDGEDSITGAVGRDVLLGDHGIVEKDLDADLDTFDRIASLFAGLLPQSSPRLPLGNGAGPIDDFSEGRRFAASRNDILLGDVDDDTILGGDGRDFIDGQAQDDILLGDNGQILFTDGLVVRIESIQPTNGDDDTITGGIGDDTIIGGTAEDTLTGNDGEDLIFGDHGTKDFLLPANANFFSIFTQAADLGGDDSIEGNAHDDTIIGGQGGDILRGGTEDDDLIGGHNVAGGIDDLGAPTSVNDRIDGGAGDDAIAGDNASIVRTGAGATFPLYRVLAGTTLYDPALLADVTGAAQINPDGAQARDIELFDTFGLIGSPATFGADSIAGGAGDDLIFGQKGDDVVQGDSTVDWDVQAAGLVSVGAASDGDDYIEGNGGNDLIFGDRGQDDLVGGSSSLFGQDAHGDRVDGSDTIFGNVGDDIARNTTGDRSADGHAADADVILGDNGNIYRVIGTNGASAAAFLGFVYDDHGGTQHVIARAFDLLDRSFDGGPGQQGAGDLIHGEAGDDTIHGVSGDDTLFGEGQDDDVLGGDDADWISGGTGEDGVLGDDGRIFTSRNSLGEPLYAIAATTQDHSATRPDQRLESDFNVDLELKKTVDMEAWDAGGDDTIYGGLGDDSLHGGAADDGISGAEAMTPFYADPASTPLLVAQDVPGFFEGFDVYQVRYRIDGHWLNFDHNTGVFEDVVHDGDDAIFGDDGNDWLVGGTDVDHLFGGWGNDVLNGDDYLDTRDGVNDRPDPVVYNFADTMFGGAGVDIMIHGSCEDRSVDMVGAHNGHATPFHHQDGPHVTRSLQTPQFDNFLYALSESDGADQTRIGVGLGDPARNGEPFGELALLREFDEGFADQFAPLLSGIPFNVPNIDCNGDPTFPVTGGGPGGPGDESLGDGGAPGSGGAPGHTIPGPPNGGGVNPGAGGPGGGGGGGGNGAAPVLGGGGPAARGLGQPGPAGGALDLDGLRSAQDALTRVPDIEAAARDELGGPAESVRAELHFDATSGRLVDVGEASEPVAQDGPALELDGLQDDTVDPAPTDYEVVEIAAFGVDPQSSVPDGPTDLHDSLTFDADDWVLDVESRAVEPADGGAVSSAPEPADMPAPEGPDGVSTAPEAPVGWGLRRDAAMPRPHHRDEDPTLGLTRRRPE